jgi:Na+-transporting methylmalonyl-CoA/oxaloacetate decarboxylase gamma subunit
MIKQTITGMGVVFLATLSLAANAQGQGQSHRNAEGAEHNQAHQNQPNTHAADEAFLKSQNADDKEDAAAQKKDAKEKKDKKEKKDAKDKKGKDQQDKK